MAKTSLSPELERRYSHELTDTLDRIDSLRVELKEETKERRGEIAALEKAAWRLRMLLKGKEVEQTEIPGSEIPSVKPSRGIESITLRAGGREVTATPGQMQRALNTLDEAKRVARRKGNQP